MKWLLNKIKCHKEGHKYERIADTLGGVWIKCTRCGHLDEHLPGLHEPKGYHETDH